MVAARSKIYRSSGLGEISEMASRRRFYDRVQLSERISFRRKNEYKDVIVEAAKSLFHPFPSEQALSSRGTPTGMARYARMEMSVIIDNMMNLELLFEATAFSGDSAFYNIKL